MLVSLTVGDRMLVHNDGIILVIADYRRSLRRLETVDSVQRNFKR
jgi:hypothetical protein